MEEIFRNRLDRLLPNLRQKTQFNHRASGQLGVDRGAGNGHSATCAIAQDTPGDVWPEVFAADSPRGREFDVRAVADRNAARAPVVNDLGRDADSGAERGHTTADMDCLFDWFHSDSLNTAFIPVNYGGHDV